MVFNMNKKIVKEIISWVLVIAIAFGSAKLINKFILYNVSSPTGSMETTFLIGEKVAVLRPAYLFSKPKRGDIVVFEAPDSPKEDYIKRIIGLPGETIEGKGGVVYIDGKALKEDYIKEPMDDDGFGPVTIPEGHYFMMGDNRNSSWDARYWTNQFVAFDKIKGKALYKFWRFKWLA